MLEKKKTREELEWDLRSVLPDFDYCSECGKPIWGLTSMLMGMGPICAIKKALYEEERKGTPRHPVKTTREIREELKSNE